jgi:hypothetical protein
MPRKTVKLTTNNIGFMYWIFLLLKCGCKSIPVAARVCGRLVPGVEGSNPVRGMDVCLLCLYVVLSCVGRGLCDGLITRPEKSYRVSVCV